MCGFCGALVASERGIFAACDQAANIQGRIYVCPNCTMPSFLTVRTYVGNNVDILRQVPGISFGENVPNLPADVAAVYEQGRHCMSVNAYGAVVMLCRRLLMHVAVERGAPPGASFADYVQYLVDHGYVAPTNQPWVDAIRQVGNEANHELPAQTNDDAKRLLEFSEMLLKIVYDYPTRV